MERRALAELRVGGEIEDDAFHRIEEDLLTGGLRQAHAYLPLEVQQGENFCRLDAHHGCK